MTAGSDISRLLQALGLASFPYRELESLDGPTVTASEDGERWMKSLAILRREFERASATHAQATQNTGEPSPIIDAEQELPPEPPLPRRSAASAEPVFPGTPRPQLQRLFQRERRGATTPQERALAEIFTRLG